MKRLIASVLCLPLLAGLLGCAGPTPNVGAGPKVGDRPTLTPSPTNTPTRTQTPTATAIPPTETATPPATELVIEPTATPTATPAPATPTLVPTPDFSVVRFESDILQLSFDMPETWAIDDNFEEDGIIQIADNTETLYSGSVRRGKLITIIGIPDVSDDDLTAWITLISGSFKNNYLADDGQTSLSVPIELNGYRGLRIEQKGSYTVVDPPEPVTLKIVVLQHNGWLVTIATGAGNDGLNRGASEFEWLVNSINITAQEPEAEATPEG